MLDRPPSRRLVDPEHVALDAIAGHSVAYGEFVPFTAASISDSRQTVDSDSETA